MRRPISRLTAGGSVTGRRWATDTESAEIETGWRTAGRRNGPRGTYCVHGSSDLHDGAGGRNGRGVEQLRVPNGAVGPSRAIVKGLGWSEPRSDTPDQPNGPLH